MNRQNILKTAITLAATLLIAACTNDEMADSQPETLPEGMYPLTFTATQADIVASPQTRVTDSDVAGVHKSKWTADDRIKVIVEGGGNNMETTCTLNENGDITGYDPQLYWKTTQTSKINAWYSNIKGHNTTSRTVSLDNQSDELAYVLKANEVTNAKYNSPNISLNFKHQLAKVRVKLEKGTYEGDLSNATVKMKGYTSCFVNDGAVTAGSTTGDITMHKATYGSDTYYEANAVPGTALKGNAFEISADGKTTTANLTSEITLTAATVHTVTLTINKKEPTVITGGKINKPGDYIMTNNISEKVILDGDNISLILDNVSSSGGIEIKRGTPTIQIKGTNTLTEVGIVLARDANVVIQGDGSTSSKLTIRTTQTVGIGVQTDGTNCGNITIKDVEVDVEVEPSFGAAAIGGTDGFGNGCGDILIENSVVRAKGGMGAAAIGFGLIADSDKVGTITINKSKIYVTTVSRSSGDYGACIGFGSLVDPDQTQTLGLVTISTTESEEVFFGKDRFKAIDINEKEVTTGFYKVGKTTKPEMQGGQSWSGLMFNNIELVSRDASGYQ